jgi:hypothetical protein
VAAVGTSSDNYVNADAAVAQGFGAQQTRPAQQQPFNLATLGQFHQLHTALTNGDYDAAATAMHRPDAALTAARPPA